MTQFYPHILTFVAAELIFLLARSMDIIVVFKSKSQRTKLEQHQIERGLTRSILLEAFLFVPASSTLLLLIAPVLLPSQFTVEGSSATAVYSILGITSYGFPFATVKRIVTRVALNTLREFVRLVPQEAKGSIETNEEGQQ